MGAKNNAKIPNIDWMIKAGINPNTGLPVKLGLSNPAELKTSIKKQLRVIDEQDAVNKGKWYNIPCDLTSQDLERMLYYKFQLCFFYNKDLDQCFFLPFTSCSNDGTGLDVYGRYRQVRPISYVGSAEDNNKHKNTPIEEFLSKLHLNVKYSPVLPENLTEEDLYNSAVILQDYTPQYNNMSGIPRYILQDPLLDVMAECIPYARTNMITSCGIKGIRVPDSDQAHNVIDANQGIKDGAMNGEAYVPIEGNIDFQELTDNNTGKVQDYFLTMQSLDNYRLSTYGVNNGGLFEKKAHELQSQADINGGQVGLVQQDFVTIRQNFCNIVNSIWGWGIWYEPAETISQADTNGDGVLYDRDEQGESSGIDNGGGSDDSEV
jgi:hypothetical protein